MSEIASPPPATDPAHRFVVVADRIGATQHISFAQPLAAARAAGHAALTMATDKKLGATPEVQADFWAKHRPTALFLSRYTGERAAALVARARAEGVPVIYHIDDDLLAPPISLGPDKYAHYSDPARLAGLRATMELSDLIYASTTPLRDALVGHGLSRPVVAGRVYCTLDTSLLPPPLPATGPVIGYMGTEGHAEDLALVLPVIERLMDAMPELRFETFGTIAHPARLARFTGRTAHHAPLGDYGLFLARLASLGWWVGLAPLQDGPFNRCKADTKWVEYGHAGMAVVASAGPVYARACADGAGLLAGDDASWAAAIGALLREAPARAEMLRRARDRLRAEYDHAALAAQLFDVVAEARRVAAGANR
ncbi:hypothetical protein [Muricoccus radiodurans]|uniref:hypothetical protein n=1 Tax=Muricoccus radiodurans TaxID=2231721 RepID=UPI003CE72D1F